MGKGKRWLKRERKLTATEFFFSFVGASVMLLGLMTIGFSVVTEKQSPSFETEAEHTEREERANLLRGFGWLLVGSGVMLKYSPAIVRGMRHMLKRIHEGFPAEANQTVDVDKDRPNMQRISDDEILSFLKSPEEHTSRKKGITGKVPPQEPVAPAVGLEKCNNCGKIIGETEAPWVFNGRIVCAKCWQQLKTSK